VGVTHALLAVALLLLLAALIAGATAPRARGRVRDAAGELSPRSLAATLRDQARIPRTLPESGLLILA
jgi:hypothetical protein